MENSDSTEKRRRKGRRKERRKGRREEEKSHRGPSLLPAPLVLNDLPTNVQSLVLPAENSVPCHARHRAGQLP